MSTVWCQSIYKYTGQPAEKQHFILKFLEFSFGWYSFSNLYIKPLVTNWTEVAIYSGIKHHLLDLT